MDGVYAVGEISRTITPIPEEYGISRAYLFGSYAREDALSENDIDLRINGGQVRSMFGLGGLYSDLTEALHKPMGLAITKTLDHHANTERTESFEKHIKEDEEPTYEEESR